MRQPSLLSLPEELQRLPLPGAELHFMPNFLDARDAALLMSRMIDEIPWQQDVVKLFGKAHPLPRLHQWFGDTGLAYTWSGITLKPLPWPNLLASLRRQVEAVVGESFNSVLVNRYRSGADCVSWHSDDEPELGDQPLIASISLGAERDFLMRRKARDGIPSTRIRLSNGSLLVMAGQTQNNWQHALPRRKAITDERINLTFRRILPRREAS